MEPVIAGLDPKTQEPYICDMDLIGCLNEPEDFVASGTCSEQAFGMCEALWEPNLVHIFFSLSMHNNMFITRQYFSSCEAKTQTSV